MKRTRLRPVSKRTRTVRWPILTALREAVLERAGHRCEWCGSAGPLDVHHVVPRSAKRDDTVQNATALCRPCHRRCAAPYIKGRLVFRVTLHGRPQGRMVFAKDKWEARG